MLPEEQPEEVDIEFYESNFIKYRKCYCHKWFERSKGFPHNSRVYCSENCGLLRKSVEDKPKDI